MRILNRILRQKAVYWEPGKGDKYGESEFKLPVQIKCRWEDAKFAELVETVEETVFKSFVYVDREVKEKGKLWLGKIDDLKHLKDEEGRITPPEDASEIRNTETFPTMRANQFLRIAKL